MRGRAIDDLDLPSRLQRVHIHGARDHVDGRRFGRSGGRCDRGVVRTAARRRPEPALEMLDAIGTEDKVACRTRDSYADPPELTGTDPHWIHQSKAYRFATTMSP
jgi:hypothetical protein